MSWGQAHLELSELVEPQFVALPPGERELTRLLVKEFIKTGDEYLLTDSGRKSFVFQQLKRHRISVIQRNWRYVRQLVWERDGGICQVCKEKIEIEKYQCGHMVDRVCGGSDKLDNLVVMCSLCNELKELHRTVDEYLKWVETGGVMGALKRYAVAQNSL